MSGLPDEEIADRVFEDIFRLVEFSPEMCGCEHRGDRMYLCQYHDGMNAGYHVGVGDGVVAGPTYIEVDGLAMCVESGAPINDGETYCTDWHPGDPACVSTPLYRKEETQ